MPCFKFKAFILKAHMDRSQTSHGARSRWLPNIDLQQRGFAVLFEGAFRGKTGNFSAFAFLSLLKKSYRNIE